MPDKTVTINCNQCKGSGHIVIDEHLQTCPACEGKGYEKINFAVFQRRLQAEQKHRKEKEK